MQAGERLPADETRLVIAGQDNSGAATRGGQSGPAYLQEWQHWRAAFQTVRIPVGFADFDSLSIVLRIGGEFGDFGGGYGPERRRISRKSRYLGCDMVMQYPDIVARPDVYTRKAARNDLRACLNLLAEHPSVIANPLKRELLGAKLANILSARQEVC